MDDYDACEKMIEENHKRNEKFIEEFESWLIQKDLAMKTIRKHLNNASLYINDYLNYYAASTMEDGENYVHAFLNGWFIEKCPWSSRKSLKETAASIKKIYQCMSEKGYVNKK